MEIHEKLKVVPRWLTAQSAWVEHIPFVMELVAWQRPGVIVELGTHGGDSYCAMCQAVKGLGLVGTRCTAVDTWQGDPQTGMYGPEVLEKLRRHHDPLYGTFSRLMQGTFEEAAEWFATGSVDLLHIDGMHTYEAVKGDFERWLPKLSRQGIVLFHDTQVQSEDFGVWRLWAEVAGQHRGFEFLHGHGLGVLAVGTDLPPEVEAFFERATRDPQRVRRQFSALGKKVSEMRGHLRVKFDVPLVEAGGCLLLAGSVFSPDHDVTSLAVEVEGVRYPVIERRQERLEEARAFAVEDPAYRRALRSGFWIAVPAHAGDRLCLRAQLREGGVIHSRIEVMRGAAIHISAHRSIADPLRDTPRVCVCMATFNPEEKALRRQVDSLRAQTHDNWVCVVQDDASGLPGWEVVRRVIGDDQRFVVTRNEANLGFYKNFERVLERVPEDCELVCLCDQDDFWYPEKMKTLVEAMRGGAMLAYSDMRIVADEGGVVSETYWAQRRNNFADLEALFFANTVTGAASMFRAGLLERVLPLPAEVKGAFHDWWIALVALASGRIEYVGRPLYDYYQHEGNALGWAAEVGSPLKLGRILQSAEYRGELRRKAAAMYAEQGKFLCAAARTLRERVPRSAQDAAIDRVNAINTRPLAALCGQMVRSAFFRRASETRERNMLLAFLAARWCR